MSDFKAIQIGSADPARVLTPEQKRFNTLIRQIGQARKNLLAWKENALVYARGYSEVHKPLQDELHALFRQRAFAFDEAYDRKGWTATQRQTLSELACEAAGDLLEAGIDDLELRALFARHAQVDFDTDQAEAIRAMREFAESATGLDLSGDEEITSQQAFFQRIRERMEEQMHSAEPPKAPARKTAAELRRETEAQQATQSVRDVFRKLASALHPDRETDADQRAIKTDLMQRANQAYANNDLLTLLELQLQIEQVDAGHLAQADSKRVKHYNKVLAEQLAELKAEIAGIELAFRVDFRLGPDRVLNPGKLMAVLALETQRLHATLGQVQEEIYLLDDMPIAKRWLKMQQRRMDRESLYPDGFS